MKIVLASRNQHKIAELRALLSKHMEGIEILSLDDVGFYDEIVENGATFEENALIKARAAARSGWIGMGDDSGLTVRALGGAPGIYSARYAGGKGDAANNALLLENMKEMDDRYGEFVCVIACVLPDGEEFTVRGVTGGELLCEYHGEGGFGYDPLFYLPEYGKTYAEMTAEEKNAVSHRARAIALMAKELTKRGIKEC